MHLPRPHRFTRCTQIRSKNRRSGTQGILLRGSDSLTLQACPNIRKSVTGYILLLGNSPATWKSNKLGTISRSFSEADYRAMAAADSEVTWLSWLVRLLEGLRVTNLMPVTLHCDNQSAIYMSENPVFHEWPKHREIDCHFTQDNRSRGASTTHLFSN